MRAWIGTPGVTILLLLLANVFTLRPHVGQAAHVGCGDTITVSTVLDGDLLDCPGGGIIIGADHIILDLNGHVIDGVATAVSPGVGIGVGLMNRTGVHIKGPGTIREFHHGISIGGGNNRVEGLEVAYNIEHGITGGNVIIKDNTVHNNGGSGIKLGGANSKIVQNEVYDNAGLGGVTLSGASDTKINRNNIHDNKAGIRLFNANNNAISRNQLSFNVNGIHLNFGSSGNDIERNVITSDTALQERGVLIGPDGGNDNNTLRRNIIANNAIGAEISAGNANNVIELNHFSANNVHILDNGTGTVIQKNVTD